MTRLLLAVIVSLATLAAAASSFVLLGADDATVEDKLRLQVVLLRGQLAEALKAQAKCEAEGSQASRQLQDAQTEGQALLKALDARGLMIDQANQIVPKPAPEKKP